MLNNVSGSETVSAHRSAPVTARGLNTDRRWEVGSIFPNDQRDLPGWELLQEIKESDAATLIGIIGIKSSGPGCNQACSPHKSQND